MTDQTATKPILTLPRCEDADFPSDGASSFKTVNLRGDMMTGSATFLSSMAAGAVATWHWHTHTEELVVLKGTIIAHLEGLEPVRVSAGGYTQLPGKHVHRFRCTDDEDCLIFVVDEGAFDLHWVDDKGREISEAEADQIAKDDKRDW